jgi:hypothetical protein
MSTDDAIRASDADREHAVGMLRDAYACGRLTLDEFDERTTAAFASRTWGELRGLTRDLPAAGQRGFLPPAPVAPSQVQRSGGQPPADAPAGGGHGLTPVLLIALYWLTLTVTVHHADEALIPVVFLLLLAVRSAARVRCGPGSVGRRPPGQPLPSRPPAGGPHRPGDAP